MQGYNDVYAAAEMAAESTVDRLYERATANSGNAAGAVIGLTIGAGLVAAALWNSKGGQKLRRKVALAVMPKNGPDPMWSEDEPAVKSSRPAWDKKTIKDIRVEAESV